MPSAAFYLCVTYSWNTPQGNGGIDFGYPIIHFWGRELAIAIMKKDSDRRILEKNNWIFDGKEDLLQSIFRSLHYILFDADIVTGVTAFLEQTSETVLIVQHCEFGFLSSRN